MSKKERLTTSSVKGHSRARRRLVDLSNQFDPRRPAPDPNNLIDELKSLEHLHIRKKPPRR